jgi:ribosomal protein L11 methyltransferase
MKYIQAAFHDQAAEKNEIVIAMLADMGFEGFEEDEHSLKAFIEETKFDKAAFESLMQHNGLSCSLSEIEQQNWNAVWESSFEPVIIGDFAGVRAGFHEPLKNVQHEIIITPKMSFGTGHHATTYLMMEQMSALDFTGKAVLDFGTGTGVLAILAEKMGASSVMAVDNDEWSIDNAKENIANNDARHIALQMADTILIDRKYDIILANINLNVILRNMEFIAAACNPGAAILLSGFLSPDEAAIKAALQANNLAFSLVKQQKGWLCARAQKG